MGYGVDMIYRGFGSGVNVEFYSPVLGLGVRFIYDFK
jgi:hypothetical protein